MYPSQIKIEELEALAQLQCTQAEIAAFFAVSTQAVEAALRKEDFRAAYERGKEKGKISLRRAQMQSALGGNVTMLIWMGKQLLGQRDIVHSEHSGDVTLHGDSQREQLISKLTGILGRDTRTTAPGSDRPQ